MKTLPNPIRDILGEIAPPPHISQSQYEKALAAFIGDTGNLNPMEVFLASEIFRQFKQIEYFQIRRRRLEAQTRLLESELADEQLTINQEPNRQEAFPDELRATAGE